jgi:hypothetical protein
MKRMNLVPAILVLLVLLGCSAQPPAETSSQTLPAPSSIPTQTVAVPTPTLPELSPVPTSTLPALSLPSYEALPFPIQTPAETLPVPSHVYAFGDSYSDNGNLIKIAPYIFSLNAHWEGRSSDGPVAVEVFAEQLGVGLTDYAVGGARSDTVNVITSLKVETGFLAQVKNFREELNGNNADPEALYFIMIGINDYITGVASNSDVADMGIVQQVHK